MGWTSFEVADVIGSQQVGLATDRTQQNMAVVRDLIKELRIGRIKMSLGRGKLFLLGRKRNMIVSHHDARLDRKRAFKCVVLKQPGGLLG